jgi:glutamate 5-kinase
MLMNKYSRIVVKVGSNLLTRDDGTLDVTRMSSLTDQIASLRQSGIEVIMVSSGAVASGRSELSVEHKLDSLDQRQLFSAVGQAKLINRYYELFSRPSYRCRSGSHHEGEPFDAPSLPQPEKLYGGHAAQWSDTHRQRE